MVQTRREIFFLNGTREHWKIGKARAVWGLPLHGRKWTDVLAELQEAGFAAGAEALGIAGPHACLRAVVGSDRGVYKDDTTAPFGMDSRDDVYPVRIELTKIQEINQPWYLQSQGDAWRTVLEERYFTERCLYVLRRGVEDDRHIDWQVVFGSSPPPAAAASPEIGDPESMENRTVELFADIGFRVEQLGHMRPHQRVPDGVASLPRSLSEHLQRMNEKPYFILWDSKFDCGPQGLTADEERAVREYVTDFAQRTKLAVMAPEFWFLIVARTPQVASRIQASIDRATWPQDLHEAGCRGLRTGSLDWVRSVAAKASEHRRSGHDPDHFLAHEIPRMLRTLSSR